MTSDSPQDFGTSTGAASALSAGLGRVTKADIVRLEKIVASLQRGEAVLAGRYGPPTPRSLRATNIKDRDALARILAVVRSGQHEAADEIERMRSALARVQTEWKAGWAYRAAVFNILKTPQRLK